MPKATSATQKFIPVQDVKEDVLILKNGKMCVLLLASSINFALKAQDEQMAILQQFQSFLNTLDFTLQIYIQSRKLNIEPYLEQLREREDIQRTDLMKIQLKEYIDFIERFTVEVDVMTKNFFVVVPYQPGAINTKGGILNALSGSTSNATSQSNFEENRTQLEQRVNIVESGLNRLGVKTIPLKNDELVELYYHIFNPQDIKGSAPKN